MLAVEETISINVGTPETPWELKIGKSLTQGEQQEFSTLLGEFIDVFAWSYEDMTGIDREIAEHAIPLYPDAKPVQQRPRRIKNEWSDKIHDEVRKQLEAKFIRIVEFPQWVANIVPVPKEDGKVCRLQPDQNG